MNERTATTARPSDIATLARANYLRLITYRRSGDAVATPVWFALAGTTIYVVSDANAGKVKRIRHTPRVAVAACDVRGRVTGPMIEGTARILSDPAEIAVAEDALARKYGLTRKLYLGAFALAGKLLRRQPRGSDYLSITLGKE